MVKRRNVWRGITVILTLMMLLLAYSSVTSVSSCPLFVSENSEFLTDITVTPLNENVDYLADENHEGMPLFSVAPNETYSLKIDFTLTDATTAAFFKILRCGNEDFPELYRITLSPSQLSTGENSIVVTVPSPSEAGMDEASAYMIKVIGVAGHLSEVNWNTSFEDGCFTGRSAEELGWKDFEVAYQFGLKVEGEIPHNPFISNLTLTPSKTELSPEESFTVTSRYYRTYYCPSDYFKFFAKNEQTGEIAELGRWAAGYWEMVPWGWQTFTQTLIAPSTPGTYIVKAVGCSGHGYWPYYFSVRWDIARSDGGFSGHRPEELSWTFYEIAAEFTITITVSPIVDLEITDVKPVQVIFDPDINNDNRIDLVEDKSTAVLIYVTGQNIEEIDNEIKIKLVYDALVVHESFSKDEFAAKVEEPGYIIFDLPVSNSGVYTLTAIIDPDNEIEESNENNNEKSVEVNVIDTRSLALAYFRVDSIWPANYGTPDPAEFSSTVNHSGIFVKATYPIAENEFVNVERAEKYIGDPLPKFGLIDDLISLAFWKWILRAGDRAVGVVSDAYFAYHDHPNTVGIMSPGIRGAVLVTEGYWTATAHEIGHTYGLRLAQEEYITNPPGNPANGFWVDRGELITNSICFMGFSPAKHRFERWICRHDYTELFKEFRFDNDDSEVLLIGGIVHKDGSIELRKWYWLEEGIVEYPMPGDYSIRLLDQVGQVIEETNFNASFETYIDPYGIVSLDFAPFAFAIPYPENTTIIQIQYKGQPIIELNPNTKLLHDAVDLIPNYGFIKNPEQRRNALHNKIEAVEKMLKENNIKGAIQKLKHDVKDKLEKWLVDDYQKENPLQLSKSEIIGLVSEIINRLSLQI